MKTYLDIQPLPDAPIVCDMTAADDTPEQRLAEYGRLFAQALVGRERTADATVFRYAARPGVAEWIVDLATREAACCRFLGYRIVGDDDHIEWQTSVAGVVPADREQVLDEIYSVPERLADGPEAFASWISMIVR
jgi:hypothetical protein